MSLAYRILYAIGFTSWERIAEPPVADQIADLFVREETGREPPYGTALGVGCGRGIWAVELARRWHVTGVDLVHRALRRARARAEEAGVETRLLLAGLERATSWARCGQRHEFPGAPTAAAGRRTTLWNASTPSTTSRTPARSSTPIAGLARSDPRSSALRPTRRRGRTRVSSPRWRRSRRLRVSAHCQRDRSSKVS
jgi:hypothetical protein